MSEKNNIEIVLIYLLKYENVKTLQNYWQTGLSNYGNKEKTCSIQNCNT